MMRVLVFAVLLPGLAFAQVAVSGVLLDPSNAAVGGVAVVLRQGAAEISTITSVTGQFRFDAVQSGSYDLVTSVPGFDPVRRSVRVGRQPVRDLVIRLKLAILKEEVTVDEQDQQAAVAPGRNADTISVERTCSTTCRCWTTII